MSEPRQNPKPTLEELLRLKRAERPTAEFWTRFETELRQKQLTALVEKRRWWHDLPVLLHRRVYVPAGAAAVVAFSLVTVRYSAPQRVAEVENTAPRIEAADPAVEMLPATVVASTARRYEEPIAVARAVPAVVSAPSENVTRVPADPVPVRREISPSARSIAANLARLEQSEPELVNAVMGNRLSSASRLESAGVEAESTADLPSQSRGQYRLIARYAGRALSPEPTAPALVRERLARRLGEDLGDGISRIGVVGDRVSLKF